MLTRMQKMSLLLLLVAILCRCEVAWAQELFFKHFTTDNGLVSNEVHSIEEDSSGLLWLATDRGIMQYNGYGFYEMPVAGSPTIHPWFGIKKDRHTGTLYFVGFKGDVAHYKNGKLILHPENHRLKQNHILSGITSFTAKKDSIWLSFDNKSNITLLTPQGDIIRESYPVGLYLNEADEYIYTINPDVNQYKLPVYITWKNQNKTRDSILLPRGGTINYLHHQRTDSFSLLIAGIQILCYKNGEKQWHKTFPSDILSFYMIDKNNALIGMRNKGVGLYKWSGGTLTGPHQTWLRDLSVTNIFRDIQGGLWFTTIENGVFYAHPTQAIYWSDKRKIHFIYSREDRVYVGFTSGKMRVFRDGSHEQGIQAPQEDILGVEPTLNYRFKRVYKNTPRISKNDSAILHNIIQPSLDSGQEENINVTCIQHDGKNGIWVGSYQGLKYYRNEKLTDYSHLHPGLSRRITGLNLLNGKHLVIATLGEGLFILKDSTLHTLRPNNELSATIINDMDIHRDTIWLGTNRGISKVVFEADSFGVWNYGSGYGLPTLGIRKLAVSESWIFFDWVNRIVAVEKSKLQNLPPSSPPQILSALVNELDTMPKEASLRYHQNTIQINFNSINLANGSGQVYRYQLDGFDNTWRTTTERQAVFPNLPPGAYNFVLEVADGQGVFLPHQATWSFTIHPAFWQQWWFPYAIGLCILFVAFIGFTRHLQAVKNKNQLMLSLAENQQKALVQLINPHFIFNVLNSFSSAVATEDKITALTIISRFTRLIRMSIELARKKDVLLSEEVDLLEKYLELESIRFPGKFIYHIHMDPEIDPDATTIPSMLIQPFVENAIKHGIMHLFDKVGNIAVSFVRQQDLILCTVEDNGVGRDKSAEINRHKEIEHESTGIAVTLQRLQLLHEEKQKKYIYSITDKKNDDGKALGTKVVFSIPCTLKRPTNDQISNRR